MGHARRRTGAVDDLPHLLARRAQRRRSAARWSWCTAPIATPITTSARRWRRRSSPARSRTRSSSRRALTRLQRQARGERSQLELQRRQLALRRHGRHQPGPVVVRLHGRDPAEARQQEASSRTCRRSSSPDTRPAASSSRATRWRTGFTTRSASPITYVVANPSSYAWPSADAAAAGGRCGAGQRRKAAWETEKLHTKFTYGPFDAAKCPNYDRWPAGLENRTAATRRR